MTPCRDTVLKAPVSKLGWMTATFVPTKGWFGAWERSLSQGLVKGLGPVCQPQGTDVQVRFHIVGKAPLVALFVFFKTKNDCSSRGQCFVLVGSYWALNACVFVG